MCYTVRSIGTYLQQIQACNVETVISALAKSEIKNPNYNPDSLMLVPI